MANPRKYHDGPCTNMSVSVSTPILARLREQADKRNISLGQMLMPYMRRIADELEAEQPKASYEHA